jgi:hypothetical protein
MICLAVGSVTSVPFLERRPMKKWIAAAMSTVLVPLALPSAAVAQRCPMVSSKIARQNVENRKQINRLLHNPNYTPTIRTYRAQPTRFKGFDGFGTIRFRAPRGTSAVVGAYTAIPPEGGCELGALEILSARVRLGRNAYVMRLKFPGSQGKAGKLRIVLISR